MTVVDSHSLANTVIVALERMAFVLAEEIDESEVDEFDAPTFHSAIDFGNDTCKGTLVISAGEDFVTELASSMLGMDPDDFGEDIAQVGQEAIQEMANVIGGEVIVLLGGKDVEFKISLPRKPAESEVRELSTKYEDAPKTCYLESDESLLVVHVFVEGS